MKIVNTFVVLSLGLASSVVANPTVQSKATYVLQVSSNLNCDNLYVEVISDKNAQSNLLTYTSGAFASLELTPGKYSLGDVKCVSNGREESFDLLRNRIEPFNLESGKLHYAGRIILKESVNKDLTANPKVLENCNRNISKARGEVSNECRDGIGIDTDARSQRVVQLFIPEVNDKELMQVRNALEVKPENILYLPLKG